MMMAEIHVGLGDKTEALAWLEKAHQDRSLGSFIPINYPQWDPLRGDPRFQDLQRRMNLPLLHFQWTARLTIWKVGARVRHADIAVDDG